MLEALLSQLLHMAMGLAGQTLGESPDKPRPVHHYICSPSSPSPCLIITPPALGSIVIAVGPRAIMIEVGLAVLGNVGSGPTGIVVAQVNLEESAVLGCFRLGRSPPDFRWLSSLP